MSPAAKGVAVLVSVVGNLCIAKALGVDHLFASLLGIIAWTFMTTFIVAAVDESVRN